MEATGMSEPHQAGILFSDIAGSSRLYEQVGNEVALRRVETYCTLQKEVVAKHRGTVVKMIGDEVMAAFPDVQSLFDAAVAIQLEAEAASATLGEAGLHLHVGFSFGPVLQAGDDYFGETVNTAAHLARIAKAEQIVTEMEVADLLDPLRRAAIRDLDYFPIKGRSAGVHAVEVMWKQTEERTLFSPGRVIVPRTTRTWLKLEYGGTERIFDGRKAVTIGRDPASDVVISTGATSRKHATIELRGDKWVLVDRSANGTFVHLGDSDVMQLHCEEAILHGSGTMGLGQYPIESAPACITFTLLSV